MIKEVFNLIKEQFENIMTNDYDYFNNFKIILSNEQYFSTEERKRGIIYIVVKFMPATINYGQNILPITINAISEKNGLEVCQKLLLEYAKTYNLKPVDVPSIDNLEETLSIQQVYTTPTVMSNFNDVFDGFRTLFYMSGTFLISKNTNPWELYFYNEEGEKMLIDALNKNFSFDGTLDSQPYFSTQNFTESISKFGTFAFNISTFLVDNEFINKCLSIITREKDVNENFDFEIVFKNGITIPKKAYKIKNIGSSIMVGEQPTIALTFTN